MFVRFAFYLICWKAYILYVQFIQFTSRPLASNYAWESTWIVCTHMKIRKYKKKKTNMWGDDVYCKLASVLSSCDSYSVFPFYSCIVLSITIIHLIKNGHWQRIHWFNSVLIPFIACLNLTVTSNETNTSELGTTSKSSTYIIPINLLRSALPLSD